MKYNLIFTAQDKESLTEEEYYLKAIAAGRCPKCVNGYLVPRKNRSNNELFMGCSNYASSECNFTIDVDDYIEISSNYRMAHQDEYIMLDVYDNLFINAEEALIAAIEIYNKPLLNYKFQSSIMLVMNAWELLMKGIIAKEKGKEDIVTQSGNTILFEDAVKKVINISDHNISESTKENLMVLYEIRNNYMHFYSEKCETLLYSLLSKSVDDFIKLYLRYYNFKNSALLSMQYLPLFFNIKRTTIQELKYLQMNGDDFIRMIADRIIQFAKSNENLDSILFNVDINLQTVKNFKNSDLIFGLDHDAKYSIDLNKKYIFGNKNDRGLQKVSLTDEEINKIYPYVYDNLIDLKKKKGDYKMIQDFIKKMRVADNSSEYCYYKNAHPKRKTGGYYIYSQKCYDEILRLISE